MELVSFQIVKDPRIIEINLKFWLSETYFQQKNILFIEEQSEVPPSFSLHWIVNPIVIPHLIIGGTHKRIKWQTKSNVINWRSLEQIYWKYFTDGKRQPRAGWDVCSLVAAGHILMWAHCKQTGDRYCERALYPNISTIWSRLDLCSGWFPDKINIITSLLLQCQWRLGMQIRGRRVGPVKLIWSADIYLTTEWRISGANITWEWINFDSFTNIMLMLIQLDVNQLLKSARSWWWKVWDDPTPQSAQFN